MSLSNGQKSIHACSSGADGQNCQCQNLQQSITNFIVGLYLIPVVIFALVMFCIIVYCYVAVLLDAGGETNQTTDNKTPVRPAAERKR